MSTKQNAAEAVRYMQRQVAKRWGIRFNATARRCPLCGTKNTQSEPVTRVCRACKQKEANK